MGFFKSKKFTAFIIGLIALSLTEFLGVSEQSATEMAGIIGSFFPDTDVDIDGPQSIMLYTSHGKAYVDIIGYESYHKLGR